LKGGRALSAMVRQLCITQLQNKAFLLFRSPIFIFMSGASINLVADAP